MKSREQLHFKIHPYILLGIGVEKFNDRAVNIFVTPVIYYSGILTSNINGQFFPVR